MNWSHYSTHSLREDGATVRQNASEKWYALDRESQPLPALKGRGRAYFATREQAIEHLDSTVK